MNNILLSVLKAGSGAMEPAEWASLIIGIIGAIAIGVYVMPQCFKTLKTKDTASISLGMFILGAAGSFCFVLMSVINAANAKGENPQTWLPTLIGNVFSCASSCVVIYLKTRNMGWSKKFQIKEDQIPNHFREIKDTLKKEKLERKAAKKAQAEKKQIEEIKKETPVSQPDASSTIIG